MNSMMVHLIQLVMIFCVWKYIANDEGFVILKPISTDMMIARFVACMMMHINVEKDVRNSLVMMKYCVNHFDHFETVYAPFFIAFLNCIIALIVEINVMIILASINDVVNVCLKFVSLTAIVNIPR